MSRDHIWTYSQPRTDEADAKWEEAFTVEVVPVSYMPAGSVQKSEVRMLLWANRAKAERLAVRLDAFFGAPGALTLDV